MIEKFIYYNDRNWTIPCFLFVICGICKIKEQWDSNRCEKCTISDQKTLKYRGKFKINVDRILLLINEQE